jgi:MFS transporter, FHS family, glucose/mannose:H+ symporter
LQSGQPTSTLHASASRRALAGFLVSGLLLSFPGSILPVWGYHLRPHFAMVGLYFLCINIGIFAAIGMSRWTIAKRGTGDTLTIANFAAFVALLCLALTGPPAAEWTRLPGLIGLGFSAGLLNTATFHAISPAYRVDPAATVNLAGTLFVFGSFLTPLLIAGAFDFYNVALILLVVALVPAFFAIFYSRSKFSVEPLVRQRAVADVLREFTVPGAVLLSLLLFFQFGNEWAIAGWLPLFLIERLGMSPTRALVLVAAYWLALLIGRLTVQAILPRFSHAWMLLVSAMAALFGCLVLTFTNNQFGAWFGTLLVGFGFAPIYPLVVERIGARFPHYHPGFFNGIFSVALTGGMLAPATLGFAGEYFGIQVIMALPALGTFIVALLVLVIWIEAKITEWNSAKSERDGRP